MATRLILAGVLLAALDSHGQARAAAVDLRKFSLIVEGMSEAEVMYRLGPFDRESVLQDGHHGPLRKKWYYIPDGHYSGEWITEITFDGNGRVKRIDRVKP
ncbi:MAG: hypothetical protein AB7Q97_03330 [Gammaproteobacteria bacterium]